MPKTSNRFYDEKAVFCRFEGAQHFDHCFLIRRIEVARVGQGFPIEIPECRRCKNGRVHAAEHSVVDSAALHALCRFFKISHLQSYCLSIRLTPALSFH